MSIYRYSKHLRKLFLFLAALFIHSIAYSNVGIKNTSTFEDPKAGGGNNLFTDVAREKVKPADAFINIFEIVSDVSSITIEKNASGTVNLTVNREDFFTADVMLSIFPTPGLPAGVTASFNPSTVASNASSSVLTLTVSDAAVNGTYNVVVAGTGNYNGTKVRSVTVQLTIKDEEPPGTVSSFAFLSDNNPIAGYEAVSTNISIDEQDLPEILNFRANTSGAATEVNWNFKNQANNAVIRASTDSTEPYTLFETGGWQVSPGEYLLEATQVNGGVEGTVKSILITIIAAPPPSFSISAAPVSLTGLQGETISTTVTLNPQNDFTGDVQLSTNSLPQGVTATFSAAVISTSGSSTLSFAIADNATVGSSSITIQGNGPDGAITDNITIDFTVTRVAFPDFELSVEQQNISLVQGESTEVRVMLVAVDGFSEEVALEVSSSKPGVQATIEERIDWNGEAAEAILDIMSDEEAAVGMVEIVLIASSASQEKRLEINLMIEKMPVQIVPRNQFSPNGDRIDDFWIIGGIEESPQLTVIVFDRLGKEVFSAQPYNNEWNGVSIGGEELPPTTYFYLIRDEAGNTIMSGSLNLLR